MKLSTLKMIANNCWHKLAVTTLVLAGAVSASGADAPLSLFAETTKWEFKKNTGAGSFKVEADADGKRVGVLEYDFSNTSGTKNISVIASATVSIAEGATAINLEARSPTALGLTFRLVDSTGQKHQFRYRIKEAGQWVSISVPLDRKLEHFSGAADGKIHFPITSFVVSVPMPSEAKTGKVEFRDVKTP